ncbi:MAG TPA: helix-turn-helix domain-containing protein [Aliidongia sp.]|nr:helix-turn-helix domain-containing protein [Aliidongia sp.]
MTAISYGAVLRFRPAFGDSGIPETCAHCDTRQTSVCSTIGDADLHRLASLATATTVEPGASFIAEGEPAESFFNITRGTAKLYKLLSDGRRQITGFCRAGDFVGLAAETDYRFTAEAIEPVRYCRFSRRKLQALLEDFPALERRLLDFASHELVMAHDQILLLGRKTACERVVSFFLLHEERAAPCGPGTGIVRLPMTRTDIADYLGLTIETVSRTLSRLKRSGLIAAPSLSEVRLLDRARIEAIAAGDAPGM